MENRGESARPGIAQSSFSNQVLRLCGPYNRCQNRSEQVEVKAERPLVVLDPDEGEMQRAAETFFRKCCPHLANPRLTFYQWLDEEDLAGVSFVPLAGTSNGVRRVGSFLEQNVPLLVGNSAFYLVNICYEGSCAVHYASPDELEMCTELLRNTLEIGQATGGE